MPLLNSNQLVVGFININSSLVSIIQPTLAVGGQFFSLCVSAISLRVITFTIGMDYKDHLYMYFFVKLRIVANTGLLELHRRTASRKADRVLFYGSRYPHRHLGRIPWDKVIQLQVVFLVNRKQRYIRDPQASADKVAQ